MCYTVPLAAAIIASLAKKKTKNPQLNWLVLLLWGGSIMLVVDHLWNKEFFLVGGDIMKDLLLGVTMTAVTFLVWIIVVLISKRKTKTA